MSDFRNWCQRYGYEPDSSEAYADWERARANLDALERAAARVEVREAVERAREQSRPGDGEPDDTHGPR